MSQSPRYLPSGSQLPECWNTEMDRQIAWADSEGVNSLHSIIRDLKIRFTGELYEHVIAPETVQRRLDWLEYRDNDYFKDGMIAACQKAVANGHHIRPFDASTYPYLDEEQVRDSFSKYMSTSAYMQKRAAITSLSDAVPVQPSSQRSLKKGLRKVSNEQISPQKIHRPADGAENLVNSTSFQSTVSSSSSRYGIRTSSIPKRNGSNDAKRALTSTIYPETGVLKSISTNSAASPSSIAQASVSGSSTAVSTPSALNFSMPTTAGGGPKKHRPAPLDLSDANTGHARTVSDIMIQTQGG